MVVKLSTHLNTSLGVVGVDSNATIAIIRALDIDMDSGTTGNFISTITGKSNDGILVVGSGSNGANAVLKLDSDVAATNDNTLTLTNKTISLTNNSITGTVAQFNAAISNGALVSIAGSETLTNKTLTSPAINQPTITGPGSITKISTFGLRDTTVNTYDTRLVSTSSVNLSTNRTLTVDVANADKTLKLTNNFATAGTGALVLTTSNATNVTLPTTGTLATTAGNVATATALASGQNFSITGDVTANAVSFDGTGAVQLTVAHTADKIVNADINSAAAIVDTKLATISTAGKVANSATTATVAATADKIVLRDGDGDVVGNDVRGTTISTATYGTVINDNGTLAGSPSGLKGEVGAKGQKGEVGGTGSAGSAGAKGQKGEVGATGGDGSGGGSGQKGQKGEVGATGGAGSNGSNGSAGAKGQKGEVGATGGAGGTGGTGAKGQKGEVGATGGSGSNGSNGAKGQKGEVGATGGGGSNGSNGAKGQKGEVGATGGTGGAGSTGQKGEPGTFGGGNITITNQAILSNASSNWTGDPGTQGKIQYHSNRWYIVSDQSSNRIVQFRRNGSDVSYVDNSGVYQGTATSANWSDLAEKYLADAHYVAGDVVGIGGEKEITKFKLGMPLAGVISEKPGVRMNCNEDNKEDPLWPYVCLKGRVPVKINGSAVKGDYILADDNGKAVASKLLPESGDIYIGIALEDGTGEVEVKI